MHVERTIKIDQESLRKATVLARDAIAHYQKIKHPGYKRFDMNDDFQKEKALKQMLSGILSEIAAGQYLEDAGIPIISSTVEDQLFRFDSKTDKNPDFIIEFPVGSGCRRILEVKSNQSVWNDKFFRMIIPKHWWSYGQSKSLVLWTSVDIETATVFIHGFNCACTDMQVGKIKFVRTCVPNFQLLRSVPLRQLTENNDDLLYEKEEQVAQPVLCVDQKNEWFEVEFKKKKSAVRRKARVDMKGSCFIPED